jgi:hypothetical protein
MVRGSDRTFIGNSTLDPARARPNRRFKTDSMGTVTIAIVIALC